MVYGNYINFFEGFLNGLFGDFKFFFDYFH